MQLRKSLAKWFPILQLSQISVPELSWHVRQLVIVHVIATQDKPSALGTKPEPQAVQVVTPAETVQVVQSTLIILAQVSQLELSETGYKEFKQSRQVMTPAVSWQVLQSVIRVPQVSQRVSPVVKNVLVAQSEQVTVPAVFVH